MRVPQASPRIRHAAAFAVQAAVALDGGFFAGAALVGDVDFVLFLACLAGAAGAGRRVTGAGFFARGEGRLGQGAEAQSKTQGEKGFFRGTACVRCYIFCIFMGDGGHGHSQKVSVKCEWQPIG